MTASSNSGRTTRGRYEAKVEVKAGSSNSCPFCWFVTSLYPNFVGMTARDGGTFREHLKRSHGLVEEISQ